MNVSDPYESPSSNSPPQSWRQIDFFAVGLWLVIPVCVLAGQQLLLPIFDEFEVELSTATQYLLNFYALFLVSAASVIMLGAILVTPSGRMRRRVIFGACILGVASFVVCLFLILRPLISLVQDLG